MKYLDSKNKKLFNSIAWRYDKFFGNWIIGTQKKALKLVNIKNNSKILDAGCGTGNFLRILEGYKKRFSLFGIDISNSMLMIAKKKVKKSKLALGSVERLPYRNNFFDYIFSTDAFHHYSNKTKAILNFRTKLKEGGKLVIIDLNFGYLFNQLFTLIEPGNSGAFTKEEMRKFFIDNGFKDIKQLNVGLFTLMTIGQK